MRLGSAQLGSNRLGPADAEESAQTYRADSTATATSSGGLRSPGIRIIADSTATGQSTGGIRDSQSTYTADATATASPTGSLIRESRVIARPTATASSSATYDPTPSFRGAYPDLTQTITPPRWDISERDRVEGYLKRPFQTPKDATGEYLDTEFGALVATFSEFAQGIADTRNETLGARYIDIAHGQSLDNIGKLIQVPRQTGEQDPRYRIRLKAYFRRLVGGGTIDEIRQTISLLLDCDVEDVELREPFETTCARFDITLDESILTNAPISTDELLAFVAGFRAAGVKVAFSVSGSFTHRSLADLRAGVDIGEKGYSESTYSGTLF